MLQDVIDLETYVVFFTIEISKHYIPSRLLLLKTISHSMRTLTRGRLEQFFLTMISKPNVASRRLLLGPIYLSMKTLTQVMLENVFLKDT